MAHLHDSEADRRFREMFRMAEDRTVVSMPPPATDTWAAGIERIRRRRRRRASLAVVAAACVLVALSMPVLDIVDDGSRRGPSEVTTTDTDQDDASVSSTTTTTFVMTTTTVVEAPVVTIPADASLGQPATDDPPEPTSEDLALPAPITTTTTTAVTVPEPKGPPPTTIEYGPLAKLVRDARAAFGTSYGGVTGRDESDYALHLKPGLDPLPATFQGYPVVAAAYSWAELEAVRNFISSRREVLLEHGVAIQGPGIDRQNLMVLIPVYVLTPSVEAAALEILGEGPWYLYDATAFLGS